jgi:cell wall-associated NlpC family hydrolase
MKRKYSSVAVVHRTLKMTPHGENPQRGDDVKVLQRAINDRRDLTGDAAVKVDGNAGRDTVAKGRRLYVALGGSLYASGLTAGMQLIIRKPERRNKIQLDRAKKYRKEHPPEVHVKIEGNRVTGGSSTRERVVAAAMAAAHGYATGKYHWFYSQPGAWNYQYGITGPRPGMRSDCSLAVDSWYWSGGAQDPAGQVFRGGNTDTLAAHMEEITRSQLRPGDLIIYFRWGRSHHVEMWVGTGDGVTTYAELAKAGSPYRDCTIGHGTPPVDKGDIDMLSGARFFRSMG